MVNKERILFLLKVRQEMAIRSISSMISPRGKEAFYARDDFSSFGEISFQEFGVLVIDQSQDHGHRP
jgi:hypothetical protein